MPEYFKVLREIVSVRTLEKVTISITTVYDGFV